MRRAKVNVPGGTPALEYDVDTAKSRLECRGNLRVDVTMCGRIVK